MTEILEDSIFIIVFSIVLAITVSPVSETASFHIGWMLVLIPMSSLLFTFGIIIATMIVRIKKACRRRKPTKSQVLDTEENTSNNNLSRITTINEDLMRYFSAQDLSMVSEKASNRNLYSLKGRSCS